MKVVHFLGIGGSGASAIASIAQAQGYQVTGCDKSPHNEFTTHFETSQIVAGHSPDHLEGVDILAITPAILSLDPNNPELQEAHKRGIEVLTWQQFMGKYITQDKFVIAVCGTHGKSTTTAMIGAMLEDAGLDPTVELGANVPKWRANFRLGKGKYFVGEADEFNNNFFAFTPDIAVLTTIEMDHPEFFKDFEDYKASFDEFLGKTKGTVVANMSDSHTGDVIKYVMKSHGTNVIDYSRSEFGLDLMIPGKHNLLNAQAAFQVGLLLGISSDVIRNSLNNFEGIERRLELIGQFKGSLIYSSFGHHPTEIKVDIEALKGKHPDKKLWMVFQPHMFSRTKYLFEDFVKVFKELPVEGIVILDIYPSREVDTGQVTSKQLVEAISEKRVEYLPSWQKMKEELTETCTPDDVIVFMGAGDTDKWAKELVENG